MSTIDWCVWMLGPTWWCCFGRLWDIWEVGSGWRKALRFRTWSQLCLHLCFLVHQGASCEAEALSCSRDCWYWRCWKDVVSIEEDCKHWVEPAQERSRVTGNRAGEMWHGEGCSTQLEPRLCYAELQMLNTELWLPWLVFICSLFPGLPLLSLRMGIVTLHFRTLEIYNLNFLFLKRMLQALRGKRLHQD